MESINEYINTLDYNRAVKALLSDLWRGLTVENVKDVEVEVDGREVTVNGNIFIVVDEYEAYEEARDYIDESIYELRRKCPEYSWLIDAVDTEKIELSIFDMYSDVEEAIWEGESYYYWPW